MLASRAGSIRRFSSSLLISCFQLGIFYPHDLAHGLDEVLPALALTRQDAASFRCEAVIAPAPLIWLLYPAPLNQTALLEPIQEGIQRGDVETQGSPRSRFDQLADVVPVACLLFQQRQDQQLSATFFPFTIGIISGFHMCDYTYTRVQYIASS